MPSSTAWTSPHERDHRDRGDRGAPPPVSQPLIPPFLPRMIHRLALPIVLIWLGIVFVTNTVSPQLEVVAKTHSVSMSPTDAASFQSMMRVGSTFKEFNSDNSAMILLEGDKPLGAEAHRYYDEIVKRVEQDKKHVQHVQDFWSDPLTAAGSQSHDQKAAYVQVYLAGNMGGGLANESSEAVRKIVDSVPAPPGIKAYVTGAGPLFADQSHSGEKGVAIVTLITLLVIVVMLLWVYRSIGTVLIMLAMVFIELAAARGVVATLGNYGIMGLSTFANNMLVLMAIAAGTDYAIFVVGRYQEARGLGEDREKAFYTMFHSTAHVVLGSGLTIAGAMYCLSFCRLPYFESLGVPCAVGMLVAVIAALTLGPAILTVASFFKLHGSEAKAADPGLAPHRHHHRPLARTGFRGDHRGRTGWSARSARLQDGLRQPALLADRHPSQHRICRGRPALQPGSAQSRAIDDRDRSRPA